MEVVSASAQNVLLCGPNEGATRKLKLAFYSIGLICGVFIGILGLREYERLAHGSRLGLIEFETGRIVRSGYSFGSGPSFSYFTNGEMDINIKNCGTGPKRDSSMLKFEKSSHCRIELMHMLKGDEGKFYPTIRSNLIPDLEFPPSLSLGNNRATITKKLISSSLPKDTDVAVIRVSGKSFVVYATLQNARDLPEDGFLSLIVH